MIPKSSCKRSIYSHGPPRKMHPCNRGASRDGYCWQHHPDELEKRKAAMVARWKKELNDSPIMRLSRAVEKIKRLEGILKRVTKWVEDDVLHPGVRMDEIRKVLKKK